MKINILTIFPEMFDCLKYGVLGKAIDAGIININVINIRDYSEDKHKKCDDTPYGGGAGMLMTCQPIHSAFNAIDSNRQTRRIYLSPKGRVFKQSLVHEYLQYDEITLLCCNYEGVDQRIIDLDIDEELSIGDFVLTGGEMAGMIFINVISRYVDGVLGSKESLNEESISSSMLEYPQYTKPQIFEGLKVPEVLLSGNHQKIKQWRAEESYKLTKERREDLLK